MKRSSHHLPDTDNHNEETREGSFDAADEETEEEGAFEDDAGSIERLVESELGDLLDDANADD